MVKGLTNLCDYLFYFPEHLCEAGIIIFILQMIGNDGPEVKMDFPGPSPSKEWRSSRLKASCLPCSWLRVEAAFSHLVVPDNKTVDQAFFLECVWNNEWKNNLTFGVISYQIFLV